MKGIGVGFVSEPEYMNIEGLKAITFTEDPFDIDYYLFSLKLRKDRPIIHELFKQFKN